MKTSLIVVLIALTCTSAHPKKCKYKKHLKNKDLSDSSSSESIEFNESTSEAETFSSLIAKKNQEYFDIDACKPYGVQLNQYIPKSVIMDLEEKFEETKCNYLAKLSSFPKNIGPIIHKYEESSLLFDIVMIGTGPGCLGALKEFANLRKRILLIDQGYMPPQKSTSLYNRPSMLSSQYVIPLGASSPNCNIPKIIFTPNVVGGATSYDANTWDQGSAKKFKQWGTISKKWSWKKVTKYYKRMERVETKTIKNRTETETVSQKNGMIQISKSVSESTVTQQVRTAFTEVGIHKETGESTERMAGFSLVPLIGNENESSLLATEILELVKNEENIDLALRCKTKQIIFDNGRAVGVKIIAPSGDEVTIRVNDELILSNGPVDVVKLLNLSGLGDRFLLESLGIPVIKDIPGVGKNFLVNAIYLGLCMKFPPGSLIPEGDDDFAGMEYMLGKNKLPPAMSLSFYKAYLQVMDDEPDVLTNFYVFSKNMAHRLENYIKGFFQFTEEVENFIYELCLKYDILFFAPQLLNVESRGLVTINSADFNQPPVINTGMYSHPNDLETMMKTMEVIRTVAETEAFKSLNGELVQIPISACGSPDFSEEFKKCSLYYLSIPNLHPSGCAIMGTDPTESVVNDDLIVFGTDNLRCFGASVIPFGTASDSAASSCMIGNYGARIIAKKYRTEELESDESDDEDD